MATLTDKGGITSQAASTSLTLQSISTLSDECLIVLVAFRGTVAPVAVTYGDRNLSRVYYIPDTTNNLTVCVYSARQMWREGTEDIVATWLNSVTVKLMAAYTVDSMHILDQGAAAYQSDTATPSSGFTTEHLRRDSMALALHCAAGPISDTAPTPGSGWTLGSRLGTSLATATDNVTANIFIRSLTTADPIEIDATYSTARNWIAVCGVLRPIENQAFDTYCSIIVVGDTVHYLGNSYTVESIAKGRNVVQLTGYGLAPATECEVRN